MKTCTKCGVTKLLSQFSNSSTSRDGKQHRCKQCNAEYKAQHREHRLALERERYLRKAEELKSYQKRYKQENPDKVKQRNNEYHLRKRYGISAEEKQKMLNEQNNQCAICGKEFDDAKMTHVDHCHESSIVRGVLCRHCNIGLGHFKDSEELLNNAIRYLNKFKRS